MKSHSYTLPNGLRVLLVDTEAFPSLTTLLFIGAGSRYENEKNNGIAHFFEHMAFKGSKKYPSAEALAEVIEGLGGYFNAFTSKDYTGYYVKGPAEDAETVVDVISDMIQTPLLRTSDLEREKGVIVQEIQMYEDTPQRRVFDLIEELMYRSQALGMDIAGTKETVMSFTRKTFRNYIDELYYPNNAVLVLSGGLSSNGKTLKDYEKLVQAKFGMWKSHTTPKATRVVEAQTKPALLVKYKKSEQAHFCLAYRTFDRFDEKRYALAVLSSILGGGMSSRLFKEVREKRGLCYSVRTYTEEFDDAGYLMVYAGVEPHEAKVTEALTVIQAECAKMAAKVVGAAELKRAKEMIKGGLILSLEDTFKVASLFGQKMLFENEVADIPGVISKIESVTAKEVRELAKEIFTPEKLNLALIGPFKKAEPFQKILS